MAKRQERGIIMEYLTKDELRKLSALCKRDYYESRAVMASDEYSSLEKAICEREAAFASHLFCKLERIADSKARRIEITI